MIINGDITREQHEPCPAPKCGRLGDMTAWRQFRANDASEPLRNTIKTAV